MMNNTSDSPPDSWYIVTPSDGNTAGLGDQMVQDKHFGGLVERGLDDLTAGRYSKLERNGTEPRPEFSSAETLFLAGFFLGAAMWLAWARYWRLW